MHRKIYWTLTAVAVVFALVTGNLAIVSAAILGSLIAVARLLFAKPQASAKTSQSC